MRAACLSDDADHELTATKHDVPAPGEIERDRAAACSSKARSDAVASGLALRIGRGCDRLTPGATLGGENAVRLHGMKHVVAVAFPANCRWEPKQGTLPMGHLGREAGLVDER
jgi:hypothetical protein